LSFIDEMLERLANHSFFVSLMDIRGITKSLSILMIKAKLPLHVPMELMLIVGYLLGCVML
jgi:hypothetical protein